MDSRSSHDAPSSLSTPTPAALAAPAPFCAAPCASLAAEWLSRTATQHRRQCGAPGISSLPTATQYPAVPLDTASPPLVSARITYCPTAAAGLSGPAEPQHAVFHFIAGLTAGPSPSHIPRTLSSARYPQQREATERPVRGASTTPDNSSHPVTDGPSFASQAVYRALRSSLGTPPRPLPPTAPTPTPPSRLATSSAPHPSPREAGSPRPLPTDDMTIGFALIVPFSRPVSSPRPDAHPHGLRITRAFGRQLPRCDARWKLLCK